MESVSTEPSRLIRGRLTLFRSDPVDSIGSRCRQGRSARTPTRSPPGPRTFEPSTTCRRTPRAHTVCARGVRRHVVLGSKVRGPGGERVGVRALRPCRHRDPMLSTGSERNKVSVPLIRRDGSVLTLSMLAFVLLVACLRDALPFTSGLARHKVEDELQLVEGQPIDAATRKPTVHYRLLEEHPDGDH